MSSSKDIKKGVGGDSTFMSSLLESGKYSDLIIKCGGKEFKVHRSIVCMQSKPLAAHVDSVFITLERLITFLYTQDFHATLTAADAIQGFDQTAEDVSHILTVCAHGCFMTEKYDIGALKELTKKKYDAAVTNEWNIAGLSISLKLMYEGLPSSDRALKDIAIQACATHFKELKDRGEFTDLCKKIGKILLDILTISPVRVVYPQHGKGCSQYQNAYQHGNSSQWMCPNGGNWHYR